MDNTMEKISINNLPKVGTLIKTSHLDYYDWNTTIIKNIIDGDKTIIELNFVEEYFSKVVMFNDVLSCKGADGNSVYSFNGIISDINLLTETFFLDVLEVSKMKNIRSSQRYDVCCVASSVDFNIYLIVLNISMSGLSIYTKANILRGDFLDLIIYFSKTDTIKGRFEVKWFNKMGDFSMCGLKLDSIDEKNVKKLEKYISEMENKEWQIALKYKVSLNR